MKAQMQKGFTLIELMIVVAIIGILAAIALPAYQDYVKNSADKACLAEMKAYANTALAELMDPDDGTVVAATNYKACAGAPNASSSTPTNLGSFTQTAARGSGKVITCDLARGATCSIGAAAATGG